jgi:hypothetical protein
MTNNTLFNVATDSGHSVCFPVDGGDERQVTISAPGSSVVRSYPEAYALAVGMPPMWDAVRLVKDRAAIIAFCEAAQQ